MDKVISTEKHVEINTLLQGIERKNNINIIHAVESGSRAWGFPSADSDYDIRFIYHHKPQWYITPFDKKDHIDLGMICELDPAGWDIGKCLRLLYKGNSSVYEWLNSPVVYMSDEVKLRPFRQLAEQAFNPLSAFHHYISLAKKKLMDDKSARNAKSFLYGLRALLCAQWVVDKECAPPVLFEQCVSECMQEELKPILVDVIREKEHAREGDNYVVPGELLAWAQASYAALSQALPKAKKEADRSQYDEVLQRVIGPLL